MQEGMAGAAILGTGLVTAVGLGSDETAASVRAGVMRFAEAPLFDAAWQPYTLAQVPDDALPPLATGLAGAAGAGLREARLLRLAARALAECLRALPAGAPAPPLVLSLPETPGARWLDGAAFLAWLGEQAGGFDVAASDASLRGRAGGVAAVGRAAERIAAGGADFVVAGGVDTYRDVLVLRTLEREGRVKTERNADAFIPGEAAAFVLLGPIGF